MHGNHTSCKVLGSGMLHVHAPRTLMCYSVQCLQRTLRRSATCLHLLALLQRCVGTRIVKLSCAACLQDHRHRTCTGDGNSMVQTSMLTSFPVQLHQRESACVSPAMICDSCMRSHELQGCELSTANSVTLPHITLCAACEWASGHVGLRILRHHRAAVTHPCAGAVQLWVRITPHVTDDLQLHSIAAQHACIVQAVPPKL